MARMYRTATERQIRKAMARLGCIWLAVVLCWLTALGGLIYVAAHFILKFW